MELSEALAAVVERTKHRRWLEKCDESHPDYDPKCPETVLALATGRPASASSPDDATVIRASPGSILAGDLVAKLTRAVGADRLAKWTAKQFGVDCGCADRQRRLNEIDLKARRLLARLAGEDRPS